MLGLHCPFCFYFNRDNPDMSCNGSSRYEWKIFFLVLVVLQFYYNYSLFLSKVVGTGSYIEKNAELIEAQLAKELYKRSKIITYESFMENEKRSNINMGTKEMPKNRETNLAIFLRHIHPFLMRQLLEYRIFVIEQYGTLNFNKGALYNVGFLESQRFGQWRCLVFHDLDLLPMHGRNLYSCPRVPTHMSAAVESQGFITPYDELFGGVTVMTPAQYSAVNGYSNLYWGWGGEDDDMFIRLQASKYPVVRYNKTFGRYATLAHKPGKVNYDRYYYLNLAKKRFRYEGLNTLKYRRISVIKRKLFTHILVEAPLLS